MLRDHRRLPSISLPILLAACTQSQVPPQPQLKANIQTAPPIAAATTDKKPNGNDEQELRARALEGDDKAVADYSNRYLKREFGKPSQKAYLELLEVAAGRGSVEAKARLGSELLGPYKDTAPDAARGAKLLSDAATAGNEFAMRQLLSVNTLGDRVLYPGKFEGTSLPNLKETIQIVRSHEKQFQDAETSDALGNACSTLAHFTKSSLEKERLQECANQQFRIAYERKNLAGSMSYAIRLQEGEYLPQDLAFAAQIFNEIVNSKAGNDAETFLVVAQAASELAKMEYEGSGVPKNFSLAREHALKASALPNGLGLASVADLLTKIHWPEGLQLQKAGAFADPLMAYGWSLVAVADEETPQRRRAVEILESSLTPQQISRVQDAVAKREKGKELALSSKADSSIATVGTAFFVSRSGHALTNAHVARSCTELKDSEGTRFSLVAKDDANDIAVIKLATDGPTPFARLESPTRSTAIGDDVIVFGFPLADALSASGNLTTGIVSALSGLSNNSSQFQFTAPVQPGSSGSPVLNHRGNVVGLVVAQIDTEQMVKATHQVAQNVNFAISLDAARAFLRASQVPFDEAGTGLFSGGDIKARDVGERARQWTFKVTCTH